MPKELVYLSTGALEVREYQESALAMGQVRVRSEFGAAKHSTELAFNTGCAPQRGAFDKQYGVFTYQAPSGRGESGVGNMTVGPVMAVGAEVTELAIGDRVLIYGGFRQTHVRREEQCWKLPP